MNIVYLAPENVRIRTADLKCGEQLLLWSIRTWVMGLIRKHDVKEDIKRAYARYDVGDASTALDHFMYALSFGARCKIDIRCPLSGSLSSDELTLMNMFANYQQGRVSLANAMLKKYCADRYLMQARYQALEFTGSLKSQGHIKLDALKPVPMDVSPPPAKPVVDNVTLFIPSVAL